MLETQNTCLENPENIFRALDVELPAELTQEIHAETRNQWIDCFIETLHIETPLVAFKEIFVVKLQTLLQEDPLLFSETDGTVMQEFVYQAAQEYLNNNQNSVLDPEQSYIVINSYAINFSHISSQTDGVVHSSLRPRARPENFLSTVVDKWPNHFEELQENGFSRTMRNFIQQDFFPKIMGNNIWCEEEHIERIQKFVEFLIDMETIGGTQLINGTSTATGYTQTLNEINTSRDIWEFNSIDTRLRMASQFYDAGEIIYNTELPINPETHPRAQWVNDLWEYNSVAKPMIDFSFDSEIRLTLIYLLQKNPDAMKDIIMWENEAQAAQLLYEAHHTNVGWQKNARIVMFQKILQHYS